MKAPLDIDLETYASRIYAQLRDPLDTCLGYAEMLLEDAAREGVNEAVPELHKIYAAAQKFASLLEDSILFLKVANGQLDADAMPPLSGSSLSDSMPAETDEPLGETDASGEGALILVVDDNETNRDLLSRRLQRQGYAVTFSRKRRKRA